MTIGDWMDGWDWAGNRDGPPHQHRLDHLQPGFAFVLFCFFSFSALRRLVYIPCLGFFFLCVCAGNTVLDHRWYVYNAYITTA